MRKIAATNLRCQAWMYCRLCGTSFPWKKGYQTLPFLRRHRARYQSLWPGKPKGSLGRDGPALAQLAQVTSKLSATLVAFGGILGQSTRDDRVEFRWQIGSQRCGL